MDRPQDRRARPPTYVAHTGPLDPAEVAFQQCAQDGMITRSQLHALGATPGDIERMLRRKDLVRLASGIFVDHTGVPTWEQDAWVAVMHAWPAALSHASVWMRTRPIHVAVATGRNLERRPGVRWHRVRDLDARVNWRLSPPRVRIEHAALDAASAAPDELAAIAVLTSVVQQRWTSYEAVATALDQRSRMPRGTWLGKVLEDLALGANSVLEHEYLVRVERPHGLPRASRQLCSRAGGRRVERDVAYAAYGLLVELDGKTFHEGTRARDHDLERDLDAAVHEDARTVRLGWGQVLGRGCLTAHRIGVLLRRGGWSGEVRRCPACPRTVDNAVRAR